VKAARAPKARRSQLAQAAIAAEQAANAQHFTYPTTPLPGGPDGELVVAYPVPGPVVSINKTAGQHWAQGTKAKKQWQDATGRAFTAHADALAPYRGHRVELTFALPVKGNAHRDSHNFVGTNCKWAVDGITRTQALFPDDDAAWVSIAEPVLWVGGPEVRVRIRVAPEPWDPAAATPLI
jgi:hypothetical protein